MPRMAINNLASVLYSNYTYMISIYYEVGKEKERAISFQGLRRGDQL